jgi:predicted GNAT family acetyltransferase
VSPGEAIVTAGLRIVRHRSPRAFLQCALPVLARNRAGNSGFIAWASELDAKAAAQASLMTVQGTYGVEGVALQRHPEFVVLGESSPRAADLVARVLAADGAKLTGVYGAFDACEAFACAWRERTGHVHALRFHLRAYTLGALAPVQSAPGHPRLATSEDLDQCCAWLTAFWDEARIPDDRSRMQATTQKSIARGGLWLWIDDAPRAIVGTLRAGTDAGRIVSVYTPPAERGRGYARSLVAHVAGLLRDDGCRDIYLTADLANPASNGLYASLGFQPAGDQYHFDLMPPPGGGA